MHIKEIKKVAIAGAGGIGSHFTHHFFEYGTHRNQFSFPDLEVDLFDEDTVDDKNLLHQNFLPSDVGKLKQEVMAERYLVNPINRFMEESDFPKYQLIFSCVDSMVFRKSLYNYGFEHPELTWIDGRCTGRTCAVFNSTLDKAFLTNMLSEEKERFGCLQQHEKENNVSHTLPIICASVMLQIFLLMVRGEIVIKEKFITI